MNDTGHSRSATPLPTAVPAPEWAVIDTPVGPLLLAATGQGLVHVAFHATGPVRNRALHRLADRLGSRPLASRTGLLAEPIRQLTAYFAGGLRQFELPLDWTMSSHAADTNTADRQTADLRTDAAQTVEARGAVQPAGAVEASFNRRVLGELALTVPYGTVTGYGELARRVGKPGAAQAVGAAMGSNPLPVVVPCHRVIESDGALGGFGGGLETKRWLLALEGVLPEPLF